LERALRRLRDLRAGPLRRRVPGGPLLQEPAQRACGGSQKGMCEVDQKNIECGWQLIYDRMKLLGLLGRLEENQPIKDWRTGRDGGPGKIVREDMVLDS